MPDEEVATVRLAAHLWSAIDAEMDNAVSVAVVDGEDETVALGDAVRDVGGAQVPWVDGQWPPMEQEISISLPRSHWEFVAVRLDDSAPRYERLGYQESLDLCRRARAAIAEQVGWRVPGRE